METDNYIDCKGLKCPMPIVKIGMALKELSAGEILKAEADDPAFKKDIIALMNRLKHTILKFEENEKTIIVYIRKEEERKKEAE